MAHFLFAYGTLQPGLIPPELATLMDGIPVIGRGSVPARLYDLGGYPAAVLDPQSGTRIHGVLYNLPDDPVVLAQLDAYEEFDPAAPDHSLFRRILYPVTIANNGELLCWVYVYNRPPGSAPILAGGSYPTDSR